MLFSSFCAVFFFSLLFSSLLFSSLLFSSVLLSHLILSSPFFSSLLISYLVFLFLSFLCLCLCCHLRSSLPFPGFMLCWSVVLSSSPSNARHKRVKPALASGQPTRRRQNTVTGRTMLTVPRGFHSASCRLLAG